MMREVMVVGLICALLCACDAKVPSLAPGASAAPSGQAALRSGKTVSAELTGYNHTSKSIGAFYVDGQWGGNVEPGEGGGSFICCVDLPVPWHEGVSVTVRWEDEKLKMNERKVLVPKYDPKTYALFNVHFLRSGEIKVFADPGGLWHQGYPLTGVEAELKPGVPIHQLQ